MYNNMFKLLFKFKSIRAYTFLKLKKIGFSEYALMSLALKSLNLFKYFKNVFRLKCSGFQASVRFLNLNLYY